MTDVMPAMPPAVSSGEPVSFFSAVIASAEGARQSTPADDNWPAFAADAPKETLSTVFADLGKRMEHPAAPMSDLPHRPAPGGIIPDLPHRQCESPHRDIFHRHCEAPLRGDVAISCADVAVAAGERPIDPSPTVFGAPVPNRGRGDCHGVAPQRLAMTVNVVPRGATVSPSVESAKSVVENDASPTSLPTTPVIESVPPVVKQITPVSQIVPARVTESLRAAAVAVVSAIQVSPTLATTGVGEIRIELNHEILDGSTVRFEAKKGGELSITVHPATPDAARVLERHLETFQAQLAERVTAWRVSVGVSAWNPRMNFKQTEREA